MHPTEEVMVGEQLHDKTTEGYLQRLLSFPPDTSVHNTWSFSLYNKTFSICTENDSQTYTTTDAEHRVTLTDTHHHTLILHICSETRNLLRMFKRIVHKAQKGFLEYVNNSLSFIFHILLCLYCLRNCKKCS